MSQLPTSDSAAKSNKLKTTVDGVLSWPDGARTLKKHTWLTFIYGIGDFILVILPIYFIRECSVVDYKHRTNPLQVLAVAAAVLNGKPTKKNDLGPKVEFAMDLVRSSLDPEYRVLTAKGSYHVSHSLCSNQRSKHEDDCTLSRRERVKD